MDTIFYHIQTFYASSFRVGIYCKIPLVILKISAFHYSLSMVVISTFSFSKSNQRYLKFFKTLYV